MTPPITAVPQGARLVLATRNPGKLAELRAILAPLVPGLDPSSIISAATAGVPEPSRTDSPSRPMPRSRPAPWRTAPAFLPSPTTRAYA